jgi:hypothetical protein
MDNMSKVVFKGYRDTDKMFGYRWNLTIGRFYTLQSRFDNPFEYFGYDTDTYWIIDDKGDKYGYSKENFSSVEEWRNEKINFLLNDVQMP